MSGYAAFKEIWLKAAWKATVEKKLLISPTVTDISTLRTHIYRNCHLWACYINSYVCDDIALRTLRFCNSIGQSKALPAVQLLWRLFNPFEAPSCWETSKRALCQNKPLALLLSIHCSSPTSITTGHSTISISPSAKTVLALIRVHVCIWYFASQKQMCFLSFPLTFLCLTVSFFNSLSFSIYLSLTLIFLHLQQTQTVLGEPLLKGNVLLSVTSGLELVSN